MSGLSRLTKLHWAIDAILCSKSIEKREKIGCIIMNVAEILDSLEVLRTRFVSYDENWVRLKAQNEFRYEVSHQSPIQDLFGEGRSCASYLKDSLDTSYVKEKYMLVDEYVANVRASIPRQQDYENIGREAQRDFAAKYPENYTVRYMLSQYWEQWEVVMRVEQFLSALMNTRAYQPPVRSSPMQVIRQYVKNWEGNAQLHLGHGEFALRAQLVLALQNSGFSAHAETHAFQGHADIVVTRPLVKNIADKSYELVAECKIWKGPNAFSAALSQLCQYVTPNDSHAALIVFVNEGAFHNACDKAAQHLVKHPSCGSSSDGVDYIEFSLKPAQNPALAIPATLLLCNLTTPRYPR
ncbi:hypothetical protein [Burkholderia gladioli]|uniref:hypothetical protein n=1 Tax=Burkholderia gladioli TaxID=28095 RepID=UPI001641FACB|nr:hypothetical protein [Burkholderia gladioli]